MTDVTGETFENPTATKYTGTLDGVPIEVRGFNMRGNESATLVTDQGTFTATTTDSDEKHSETLRRFLEHRPYDGWEVSVTGKAQEDDGWRYSVTITNGRLTEHADIARTE